MRKGRENHAGFSEMFFFLMSYSIMIEFQHERIITHIVKEKFPYF